MWLLKWRRETSIPVRAVYLSTTTYFHCAEIQRNLACFAIDSCCDMGQNDTIGKIELKIIFRLAVGISNSRNDIQLFLQLFDELRVNGDYH